MGCVPKSKALNAVLKQLSDNIRRERVAHEMSQQRLAELSELNICNVQRIEAGKWMFFSAQRPGSERPWRSGGRS